MSQTLEEFRLNAKSSFPLKEVKLSAGYCMDIVVDELLVLELKSVEKLMPIHEAQLLTYLRLSEIWLGLLINFNVPILKHGIKRLVPG